MNINDIYKTGWSIVEEEATRLSRRYKVDRDDAIAAGLDAIERCINREFAKLEAYLRTAIRHAIGGLARAGRKTASLRFDHPAKPDPDPFVFSDLIACCSDEREQAVIQLLYNGSSRGEVAAELGVDPSTVSRIRARVYARYNGDARVIRQPRKLPAIRKYWAWLKRLTPLLTPAICEQPPWQRGFETVDGALCALDEPDPFWLVTVDDIYQRIEDWYGVRLRLPQVPYGLFHVDGSLPTQTDAWRRRALALRRGGRESSLKLILDCAAQDGRIAFGAWAISPVAIPAAINQRFALFEALRDASVGSPHGI